MFIEILRALIISGAVVSAFKLSPFHATPPLLQKTFFALIPIRSINIVKDGIDTVS
jgi:hypothetical protein